MLHFQIHLRFEQFFQIVITAFENQVDLVEVFSTTRYDDVDKIYYLWVLNFPENNKFSQNSLGCLSIFEDVLDPFYGYFCASIDLNSLCNMAVAASANQFLNLVLGSNMPAVKLVHFFAKLKQRNLVYFV